jgi:hypothetical protein
MEASNLHFPGIERSSLGDLEGPIRTVEISRQEVIPAGGNLVKSRFRKRGGGRSMHGKNLFETG